MAAILAIAALPGTLAIIAGLGPFDWRAFLGGCAFFSIPMLVGWTLLVGLRTGRIPSRGKPVSRKREPVWFWLTIGLLAAALAGFFGLVAMFASDMMGG